MRNKIQLFFIIIAMFSTLLWLQSCGSKNMNLDDGDNLSSKNTESDDEMGFDDDDDDEDETTSSSLTDKQKQQEFEKILKEPTSLDDKKVDVCMSYIGLFGSLNKTRKIDNNPDVGYRVSFNDSDSDRVIINLNNKTCREVSLPISNIKIKIGSDCNNADRSIVQQAVGIDIFTKHMDVNNHHVPGQIHSTVWKDGKLKIKAECAVPNKCNYDKDADNKLTYAAGIVAISMISEVELSDGSKKYLTREYVTLNYNSSSKPLDDFSSREWSPSDFKVVDEQPNFDDYCSIK